ncbi:hypothetical protein CLIB1444_20S00254 [[Candida] jaroonii]|uniref:Uncharacterized protein n=1 Tax=[Candida] jaroonii TaxID=467808 RepID=A0ACA9YGA4_9ASCO|nr:hypothetical protein CLIB1444_20S00254 [[Candida] jaroonii]
MIDKVISLINFGISSFLSPIKNFFIIPIWYIGKILIVTAYLPFYPILYTSQIKEIDIFQIYEFVVNFSQFIIVSVFFGMVSGYVLSKQLLILSNLKFSDKPLIPVLPHQNMRSRNDMIQGSINRIKERRTYVEEYSNSPGPIVKQESEFTTEFLESIKEDESDSGPSIKTEETRNDTLFDKYLDETKLTSILEDYSDKVDDINE